jgi:hypothetical protein
LARESKRLGIASCNLAGESSEVGEFGLAAVLWDIPLRPVSGVT